MSKISWTVPAAPGRKIDGLDAVSGERTARREDLVELGERLDLTVAGVRGADASEGSIRPC
ncbi:hypothetical protein [Streptomyces sp. NPDC127108]|uniref:hypothetical protein n=1 Tax=Streptomyces sp. NPDC127108 TaxID=3345361 RepID=UPI0036352DFC